MSNQQKIENYDCRDNCPTSAIIEDVKNVQNLYSPCEDCASIYNAGKIRTAYDKFWIKFYNNKAQNTPTDLFDLQFAA